MEAPVEAPVGAFQASAAGCVTFAAAPQGVVLALNGADAEVVEPQPVGGAVAEAVG